MDVPAKHPWLHERRRTWYLRAKVPVDLLSAFFPKTEIKKSLRTRDRVEASRLINREAALVQQLFDAYRKHGGPPPRQSKIVRHAKGYVPRFNGVGRPPCDLKSSEELSPQDIKSLVASYWSVKRAWIDQPVLSLAINDRKEHADAFEADAAQIAAGDDLIWDGMFRETAALLEAAGYYFDRAGSNAAKLGELVVQAQAEALLQRAARLRGSVDPTAHDRLFFSLESDPATANRNAQRPFAPIDERDLLFQLHPWREFIANRGMKPRQVKQYEADLRSFAAALQIVGNVRRPELQKFYEQSLSILSPNTVIRKFSSMRSYWGYLMTHELVSTDIKPFEGLLLPKKKAKTTRREWTPAQICDFWHKAMSRSDFALAQALRIAAFTGGRIEAICSLSSANVFIAADRRLAIHFTDKTDAGIRDVPVHSALEPMIQSMLAVSADHGGYLIKAYSANQYNDRSVGIGKRFSRLKSEQGYGRGWDFHSIRYTVVGLLSNALCPEAVAADIVGHEKPTMTYGLYRKASDIGYKRLWLEKGLVYPDAEFMRG